MIGGILLILVSVCLKIPQPLLFLGQDFLIGFKIKSIFIVSTAFQLGIQYWKNKLWLSSPLNSCKTTTYTAGGTLGTLQIIGCSVSNVCLCFMRFSQNIGLSNMYCKFSLAFKTISGLTHCRGKCFHNVNILWYLKYVI